MKLAFYYLYNHRLAIGVVHVFYCAMDGTSAHRAANIEYNAHNHTLHQYVLRTPEANIQPAVE